MNAGMFLSSTPLLDDSFFERTQLFITEVNDKGAMGFVVNKLFPRKFNELVEFRHSIAFSLYDGGPVDREHLYFIHRRPDLIEGGVPVAGDIYVGGDFKAAVKYMNNKTITENDIRLFIGYCGWDSFELEEEIAEGSWEIVENGNLF
ncbi:YqgE/AlgH family protein [Chitinophaga eiseniae]|uniref:YqgE/AlgH family protein n=1 Tax=Chitinophaga eiseniae TaxID=634771 RepID=A0A847SVC8_9BACT|nr:YqgE/AlgH family protein [Chitinophaga eiseniae]NLR82398.1 YqgE/AlgH family protein [Chitinophaga eiseniae]